MSGFMNALDLSSSKSKEIKCPKQISQIEMSAPQLKEFMTQIEEIRQKEDSPNPRKVLQLLKIIKIANTSIATIEFTQAEKYLRRLVVSHECDPFHPNKKEHQAIK